jgi:hypothetical protein
MNINLNKWEKNGYRRIYVNGAPIGGAKLYFEANSEGKVVERSQTYGVPGQMIGQSIDAAYAKLEELVGPPKDGFYWDFDAVFAAL